MHINAIFNGMTSRRALLMLTTAWLCAGLIPSEARAVYYVTGNVLLDRCTAKETGNGFAEIAFCAGYVAGIADMLDRTTLVTSPDGGGHWQIRACVPPGVTINQLMDVVVRFLRAAPEVRHSIANILATKAISDAFPCRS